MFLYSYQDTEDFNFSHFHAVFFNSNAQKSLENGAIDYVEYVQNVDQALELKLGYLNTLNEYNQAIIDLQYLIGE